MTSSRKTDVVRSQYRVMFRNWSAPVRVTITSWENLTHLNRYTDTENMAAWTRAFK